MSQLTIQFKTNRRWLTQDIDAYDLGTFPPINELPVVSTGRMLPSGKGFPYLFQEPLPSFKVIRALQEYGMSHALKHVFKNFKRSRICKDSVWATVF